MSTSVEKDDKRHPTTTPNLHISYISNQEKLSFISVYEKGAKAVTGQAKALHVNLFPHSTRWGNLTDDGWKLIERSVLYALGKLPMAVEPVGKLAVRWAAIKTQSSHQHVYNLSWTVGE